MALSLEDPVREAKTLLNAIGLLERMTERRREP
jgi:hypothetical protein